MNKNIIRLHLNPNEMAFRKIYWPQVRDQKITTVFRPGKRLTISERGYHEGQIVTIRIIDQVGADWAGIAPEFVTDQSKKIRIASVRVKKLGELTQDDFVGASPDVHDEESLRYHLGIIYNLYPEYIDTDSHVTIIKFTYLSMKNTTVESIHNPVADLIRDGKLRFARLPKNNPSDLNFGSYTLSFIEHDYQAKTPVMWNAVYKKLFTDRGNIMLVGDTRDVAEIVKAVQNDHRYLGGGAGVGFKDEIVKHVELSRLANAIGAINFIKKTDDGRLVGYNTDGLGYTMGLEEKFKSKGETIGGKKAVILGAGGTGNSIAFALAEKNLRISILNRTASKAEELAKRINDYIGKEVAKFGGEDATEREISDADVIINVSTKGSAGDLESYSALAPVALPVTADNVEKNLTESERLFSFIPRNAIVSDIVLTKSTTPFLTMAAQKGFDTLDGVPMVVNQGAEAFWILHGDELYEKGVTKLDIAELMMKAANN